MFQQFNLLPALTAAENVTVPLIIAGKSKRQALAEANHLLDKMGMADRARNLPSQLSGGQQQRVAIARALVHHPQSAGVRRTDLGPRSQDRANDSWNCSARWPSKGDRAVVIVTHDSRIFEFADTIARMDDGRIESIERQGISELVVPSAGAAMD